MSALDQVEQLTAVCSTFTDKYFSRKRFFGGGHGGHNGLRDTIAHLGTNDFQRLRLGIGHPGDSRKVTGFVLGRLGKQETEQLTAVFDEVMRVLPDAASGKLAAAMNRLHSFKPTP